MGDSLRPPQEGFVSQEQPGVGCEDSIFPGYAKPDPGARDASAGQQEGAGHRPD